MPAVYTHYLVAREVFKAFPDEIQNKIRPKLSLYFFGAQGPDFCFFYKFLDRKQNFGSFLHRKGGYSAFNVLKAFSSSEPIFAYSLGYIAHYAADVCFHPFVYRAAKKSLLKHSRIENALDGYFKRSAPADPYKHFSRPILSFEEKTELFLAYAAIAARCNLPPLSKTSFFRAIKLFNAYLPMPSAFFGKERDFGDTVISQDEPDQRLADRLFIQSVALSCQLCERFLSGSPLTVKEFGRSYLTGE